MEPVTLVNASGYEVTTISAVEEHNLRANGYADKPAPEPAPPTVESVSSVEAVAVVKKTDAGASISKRRPPATE